MVINTIRLASVSLEESLRYGTEIEGYLKKRVPRRDRRHLDAGPGVPRWRPTRWAWSCPTSSSRSRPASGGRKAKTQEELVSAMAQATKVLPGMRAVYTQPIEMRINEMVAGIRADLGIKLYGDDLETLKAKAAEIEQVVKSIPGAADTTTEQVTGLPVLRVNVDNEALSRYGVPAEAGARRRQGRRRHRRSARSSSPGRRFPLVVRLPAGLPRGPARPGADLHPDRVRAAAPALAPRPARGERPGPSTIQRDWGERRIIVQTNVRGRDIALVRRGGPGANRPRGEAPAGYAIDWGGQFEHLERAEKRLYRRGAARPGCSS